MIICVHNIITIVGVPPMYILPWSVARNGLREELSQTPKTHPHIYIYVIVAWRPSAQSRVYSLIDIMRRCSARPYIYMLLSEWVSAAASTPHTSTHYQLYIHYNTATGSEVLSARQGKVNTVLGEVGCSDGKFNVRQWGGFCGLVEKGLQCRTDVQLN